MGEEVMVKIPWRIAKAILCEWWWGWEVPPMDQGTIHESYKTLLDETRKQTPPGETLDDVLYDEEEEDKEGGS